MMVEFGRLGTTESDTSMLVHGANALAGPMAAPVARRSGGAAFKVAGDPAQTASATTTLRSLSGIDALMALQGVEDATERRKRAVRRGRVALDALDELKLGLLSGTAQPENLRRLQVLAGELKGETGDPRLDSVLAEIQLRVEVELAKSGIR
jgi:hypothetical protein